MHSFAERITVFCFAASYAFALGFEFWHVMRPRPIFRWCQLGFGTAGLLAHTAYILAQPVPLVSSFGSLLFLAWILAVFYLYGAVHHQRLAWGLFVLPLVLVLVGLAVLQPVAPGSGPAGAWQLFGYRGEGAWGLIHGILMLMAAVGVSVGCVASIMYFVQSQRLRSKLAPDQGVRMWSLERIETMNKRAILWAFPLLSVGLVVGIALQLARGTLLDGWTSVRILSTLGSWVAFAILLYLRYGLHARGRQLALWTIVAFLLLVLALVSVHPFVQEVPA